MKIQKSIVKAALLAILSFGLLISCANGNGGDSPANGNPTTPATQDVGENPIKLDVTIPANTRNVDIQRREVTKNGSTYTPIEGKDWETIAGRWIGTEAEEFSQTKKKSFTDRYGVHEGKYYEYRLLIGHEGSSDTFTSLGYHKAGYDGAVHPDFTVQNYPKMHLDWGNADGLTLIYDNYNQNLPLKCYNDETILSWTINLSYGWRWWTYFDKVTSSQILKWNPGENETGFSVLKNGNNHLTSFNLSISIPQDDYFRYQFNYDVLNDIDYEKIVESISGRITCPSNDVKGINFTVTTPNSRVVQTHIYRKQETEDDTKFEEVGFYDGYFDEKTFIDYYYEAGKTYDYQVRFTLDDWSTYTLEWLGTVKVPDGVNGLEKPSFKTAPEFHWDAENKKLEITNNPQIAVPENAQSIWGENYTWRVVFTYKFPDDGFWPTFVFDKAHNPDQENTVNTMESWQIEAMSDNEEENKIEECLIHIVEEGKIEQCVTLYQTPECNPFNGTFGSKPTWAIKTLSKTKSSE